MWVTTPTLFPLLSITPITTNPPPRNLPITTTFTRRRHLISASASSSKDVSGLGLAVLGALKSSPTTTTTINTTSSNPQRSVNVKPKGNGGGGRRKEPAAEKKGSELNGSDILRALQRAGARKAQVSSDKKQQRKIGSSAQLKRENNKPVVVDYDKVRPIVIKSDWVTRLDDLEKRLHEFSGI